MKKRFMAIFIALFFCLSFITPVYADVFLAPKFSMPVGYTPTPVDSLKNLTAVKNDANSFMGAYYDKPGYFVDSFEIDLGEFKNLSWQMYNVSDSAAIHINNPILFYELGNLGTPSPFNGERQFLGQTLRGQVITNVRYPLVNVYWTFLEDDNVHWIKDPWNDNQLKQWWKGLTGTNTDITMTEFDQKARADNNYAELINFCIKAANAVQLR